MKGRKAIPNKILELRGGRSHTHRGPKNEPKVPSKIPTCPVHLCKESKKEWRRVIKILDSIGILTELDRSILAEYCEAYGKWIVLKHELDMLKNIDVDNGCILKEITRRVEQYRSESKRWRAAMSKNDNGIIFKKENGEPAFSPYLRIEQEAADKLMKVENTIKREIRDTEDRLIKAGTFIGMSPSSRASLSVQKKPTQAAEKTELFRLIKYGKKNE